MSRTYRRKNGFWLNEEEKKDVKKHRRYHSDAFDAKQGGTSSAVKDRANEIRRTMKNKETHKVCSGYDLILESTEQDVKKSSNKQYIYS